MYTPNTCIQIKSPPTCPSSPPRAGAGEAVSGHSTAAAAVLLAAAAAAPAAMLLGSAQPDASTAAAAAAADSSLSKPLIFLDVDGVLHESEPQSESRYFKPSCMSAFARVCHATDAQLVLSSSWRQFPGKLSLLREGLLKYGIDLGSEMTSASILIGGRVAEITHYLRTHGGGSRHRWVAVDDFPLLALQPHFVKCHPAVGMTDQHAELMIGMLSVSSPCMCKICIKPAKSSRSQSPVGMLKRLGSRGSFRGGVSRSPGSKSPSPSISPSISPSKDASNCASPAVSPQMQRESSLGRHAKSFGSFGSLSSLFVPTKPASPTRAGSPLGTTFELESCKSSRGDNT